MEKDKTRILVEPLEARVLFSADPFGVAVDFSADESDLGQLNNTVSDQLAAAKTVFFVDESVANYQQLVQALTNHYTDDPHTIVYTITHSTSSIDDVTAKLSRHNNLDSVHFLTHGADSHLSIGTTLIDNANFANFTDEFEAWGNVLADDGDLLLYGCSLAESDAGKALLENIATASGADVAASINLTGHKNYGADWELEYNTGTVDSDVPAADIAGDWEEILATVLVTTEADDSDAPDTSTVAALLANPGLDNVISLREAIAAANAQTGHDFIALPENNNYVLNSEILIQNPVTIQGDGIGKTIVDGNGTNRVFNITNGDVIIESLTVTGGDKNNGGDAGSGGGIKVSDSTVTLNNVEVIDNTTQSYGAGISVIETAAAAPTELIVNNSTIKNNTSTDSDPNSGGGAIYSNENSIITINRSVIDFNTASNGGGIYNLGTLTINDTTISNNKAIHSNGYGGGIYSFGATIIERSLIDSNEATEWGGGIDIESGTLTINNSTLSNNEAIDKDGGAILAEISAIVSITNSTIAYNTAGNNDGAIEIVGGSPVVDIQSSIITNNTGNGDDRNQVDSGLISLGFNLIGDTSYTSGLDTDFIESEVAPGNAAAFPNMQTTLEQNGGYTKTYALLPGSPAIDSGFGGFGIDATLADRNEYSDIGATEFHHDSDQLKIYWSDLSNNDIYRGNSDGTAKQKIVSNRALAISDIEVDTINHRIYWVETDDLKVNGDSGSVYSANLDGSDVQQVLPNTQTSFLAHPIGIALDPDNDRLYIGWDATTDNGESYNYVQKYTLSGALLPDTDFLMGGALLTPPILPISPQDVEYDNASGEVYFTDRATSPLGNRPMEVVSVDSAGTATTEVTLPTVSDADGNVGVAGLAVSPGGDTLYWTETFSNTIYARDTINSVDFNSSTISLPDTVIHGIQQDNTTSTLFFTITEDLDNDSKADTGYVMSVSDNLTSNLSTIFSGLDLPYAIALGNSTSTATSVPNVYVNSGAALIQQSSVTLNASDLASTDYDSIDDDLIYTVTTPPQHGILENELGVEITSFTQADIGAGRVRYIHDPVKTDITDNFNFTVEDTDSVPNVTTENLFAITLHPASNDAPGNTGSLPASLTVVEDTDSVIDLSGIELTDPDHGGGQLTIRLVTSQGGEISLLNTGATNVGTDVSHTGTLADLNAYLDTLTNITYRHPTADTMGTDAIQVLVTDNGNTGNGGGGLVDLGTIPVSITPVNDAPVASTLETAALTYTENDTPLVLSNTITLDDIDDTVLQSATVSITGNFAGSEDRLLFTDQFGISGAYDITTGILTLTGSASLPDYESAIQSVTYENTSENPSTLNRTVSFVFNDGEDNSSPLNREIEVTAVNDAPALLTIETVPAAYTENGTPFSITNNLDVKDLDDTHIESATVSITNNFSSGEDVLGFTDQFGITGNFNSVNGILTLTGSATLADYEAAIHSVTYHNTSDNPAILNRTVAFIVNDGDDNSNPLYRDIVVTDVNDTPVLSTIETAPAAYTENGTPIGITGNLAVSDIDDTNIESATVSISNNFSAGEDILSFTDQLGIAGNYNSISGILTLTGTGTPADYEAAIHSVTYHNTSDNPAVLNRTVAFIVNDGQGISNLLDRDITVAAVNDAPVLSTIETAPAAYTENGTPIVITGNFAINDVDDTDIESATVSISNNFSAGEDILSFTDQLGITGNYNSISGILTLTGTATLADYEAAIHSVTYHNTSDNPAVLNRTVSFIVNDVEATSNLLDRDIVITAVNDAPVLSTIETAPAAYTENGTPIGITDNLAINDIDDTHIESVTVSISNNFSTGEDVLGFTDQSGITGSYNSISGILTLTGTATLADYEAAIHSVTYHNTSDNPAVLNRTVSFIVNDGEDTSNLLDRDIVITAVNDAPVLSTIETAPAAYTENGTPIGITGNLAINDIDDTHIESVTVSISNNFSNGEDVLGFTDQSGITGNYNSISGILTLTGTATLADYEAAIHSVTYHNTSDNPAVLNRTVSFIVNDGEDTSNLLDRDIAITAVNDAPVLSTIETAPAAYTENGTPIGITGNLAVNDVDDTHIESVTVSISNNFSTGEDILSFTDQLGITGNYNPFSGILTLTGSASLADYQAAIHSVTYHNSSDNPTVLTRTVSIIVNDGNDDSNLLDRDITFTAVNDAPALSSIEAAPAAYTENGTPIGITGNLAINDIDDTHIESVTVSVSNNFSTGEDVLGFTDQSGITGNYNSISGILTLTGSATLAGYEAAIHSITYHNTSDHPAVLDRTVSISVNDGNDDSNLLDRDITFTAVNDAPVLSSIETAPAAYTENGAAIGITGNLAINDVDDTHIETATVSITGNFAAGDDVLSFTDQPGISSSYDATNGTLTLTGSATLADYEAAIHSITYHNSSDTPTTLNRTLSFVVNDGDSISNPLLRDIVLTAVNDAPVLSSTDTTPATYTENGTPIGITGNLAVSDIDDSNLESATVSIVGNFSAAEDELSFIDHPGITGSYDNTTGVLDLAGSATLADYETVIRSITYHNTSDNPAGLTRTVSVAINDGDVSSNALARNIIFTTVNDAPVLSTIETAPAIYIENGSPIVISGNLTVNDVDNASIESATVSITGNLSSGEDVLAFTNQPGINGSYDAINGILTLTGSASLAEYETAIHSVTYHNTSDNPSALSRTVTFIVNDGDTSSNLLSRNIAFTATNDAPVISTIESTPALYTENGIPIGITGSLAINDVDNASIESATVSITGNLSSGEDVLAFTNQPGINGSYDAINGILTLTGSASLAEYETAIHSVTYHNTSDNPSDLVRTVSIIVNDSDMSSNSLSRDIAFTVVNDAPVISSVETAAALYTENGVPIGITANLSASDPDDVNIESAIVAISNHYAAGEDKLTFINQAGITSSFDTVNGQLTLTGSASIADYQSAIHSVTYHNISDNPSTLTRTFSFSINDGNIDSNVLTRNIHFTPVNDAPALSSIEGPAASYTENGSPVVATTSILVDDIDDTNIESATISISDSTTGSFVGSEDVLNFNDQPGITGTFDSLTGVLSLTGSSSTANYEAAIRSVTYHNTSDNPSAVDRTLSFIINDGDDNSNTLTRDIAFTSVNDAPLLSMIDTTPVVYTENEVPIELMPTLSINDVDDSHIESATVSISNNFISGEDVLLFTNQPGIIGSYDSAAGVLTLSGSATLADYETAIRSVTYHNVSDNPSTAARTVTLIVDDGIDSGSADRAINIIGVNDAPVAGTLETTTLHYTENTDPLALSGNITLGDLDDTHLQSAAITFNLPGFFPAEDSLSFTSTDLISGAWDQSSGVLSMSGAATVAEYQTALRSVTYHNSSDDPTLTPRTVSITVTDANDSSIPVVRDLSIARINDAPSFTVPTSALAAIDEDNINPVGDSVWNLFSNTFEDVDSSDSFTGIAITGNRASPANGFWEYTTDGNNWFIVGNVSDASAQVLSTSTLLRFLPQPDFNGTPAPLELRALDSSYSGTHTNGAAQQTIDTRINDDTTPYSQEKIELTTQITPVNDAPVISNDVMLPSIVEDATNTTGESVANIFSIFISDIDVNSAFTGLAISGTSTNDGTWEYSTDGTSWQPVGVVSSSSALVVDTSTKLRFIPLSDYNGTPDPLSVHAIDNTYSGGFTTTSSPAFADTTLNGFTSAFSSSVHLYTFVSPVNDSPVSTNTNLDSHSEDPTVLGGKTITALFQPGFIDIDSTLSGYAVSANAAASEGTWQYSTDNLIWNNIAPVSEQEALLLSKETYLRFSPSNHYFGTPPEISGKVVDSSYSGSFSTDLQRASDDISALNNDSAFSQADYAVGVQVLEVNDAPTGEDITIGVLEDDSHRITLSDFGYADSVENHPLKSAMIVSLPQQGLLTLDGETVGAGDTLTPSDIVNRQLMFTPDPDKHGTAYADIRFRVSDTGGTANGGIDTSISDNQITFNVYSVNDAPSGKDHTLIALEDTPLVFQPSHFGFTDPADENAFLSVRILTHPDKGSIDLNGGNDPLGLLVSVTDIAAGALSYNPIPSENGIDYTQIAFRVVDDGGTDRGGIATSVITNTLTIDLLEVNDAPTGLDSTIVATEDTPFIFEPNTFGFTDIQDNNALESVILVSLPDSGSVTLGSDPVQVNETIEVTDIIAGQLQYLPDNNINGTAVSSLQFRIIDNGGTANGGVNIASAPANITIDIVSVNDPPSGTDSTLTVIEDTPLVLTANSFGFIDNADNTDALSGVVIEAISGLGTLTLAGSPVQDGQTISREDIDADLLVFSPALNTYGINYSSVVFRTLDNGSSLSDLNRAQNSATLNFDVTAINDAPSAIEITETVVYENMPETIVASVSVLDADSNDTHQYLVDDERFVIVNGQLLLAPGQSLDFEENSQIPLEITVTDSTGESYTQPFILQVENVNEAPMASNPLPDQTGLAPYSFTLPTETFLDVDSEALEYSAILSDGSPLPAWLEFDADTRTFNIIKATSVATSVNVVVTARDSDGLSGSTEITINLEPEIASALPSLSAPTTSEAAEEPESDEANAERPQPDTNSGEELASLAEQLFETNKPEAGSEEARLVQIETPKYAAVAVDLWRNNTEKSVTKHSDSLLINLPSDISNTQSLQLPLTEIAMSRLNNQMEAHQKAMQETATYDTKVVGTSVTVASGLSVGYIFWILRSGTLLASMLTTLPAWRNIDPLPILDGLGESDDGNDTETLESMVRESDNDEAYERESIDKEHQDSRH